jgi:hypothetical protein
MTITTSSGAGARSRAGRKSPLRAASMGGGAMPSARGLTTADIMAAGFGEPREAVPDPQLRRMQISEFTIWLRSWTSKHHRPFQADTIAAYADAARALSEWMGGHGIDGDFTACDAGVPCRLTCASPCNQAPWRADPVKSVVSETVIIGGDSGNSRRIVWPKMVSASVTSSPAWSKPRELACLRLTRNPTTSGPVAVSSIGPGRSR